MCAKCYLPGLLKDFAKGSKDGLRAQVPAISYVEFHAPGKPASAQPKSQDLYKQVRHGVPLFTVGLSISVANCLLANFTNINQRPTLLAGFSKARQSQTCSVNPLHTGRWLLRENLNKITLQRQNQLPGVQSHRQVITGPTDTYLPKPSIHLWVKGMQKHLCSQCISSPWQHALPYSFKVSREGIKIIFHILSLLLEQGTPPILFNI